MQNYDLIIIGTGSGNTIITPEYDDLKIAVIEKGVFGGTCLNRGCIPSKMLIHVADIMTGIQESHTLGINVASPSINWPISPSNSNLNSTSGILTLRVIGSSSPIF